RAGGARRGLARRPQPTQSLGRSGQPAQLVALQACSKNRTAVTRCSESPGAFMRRRKFLALIGGAATWPLAARAPQPAMAVIGSPTGHTPTSVGGFLRPLQRGLSVMGVLE